MLVVPTFWRFWIRKIRTSFPCYEVGFLGLVSFTDCPFCVSCFGIFTTDFYEVGFFGEASFADCHFFASYFGIFLWDFYEIGFFEAESFTKWGFWGLRVLRSGVFTASEFDEGGVSGGVSEGEVSKGCGVGGALGMVV